MSKCLSGVGPVLVLSIGLLAGLLAFAAPSEAVAQQTDSQARNPAIAPPPVALNAYIEALPTVGPDGGPLSENAPVAFRRLPNGDLITERGSGKPSPSDYGAGWVMANALLARLKKGVDADAAREALKAASIDLELDGPVQGTDIVRIRLSDGPALTPDELTGHLVEVGVEQFFHELEPEPFALIQDAQHGVFFDEDQWYVSNQGKLENTANAIFDADADIAEARALYARLVFDSKPSSKVVVAIIDSGANMQTPGLLGSFWENPHERPNDDIDNDGNGYVDDRYGWDFIRNSPNLFDSAGGDGHGTPIAGIIAARRAGYQTVSGVMPDARLMILNVVPAGPRIDFLRVLEALVYAIDNGANVINMSFTMEARTLKLDDLVRRAWRVEGIHLVAAAGNENIDIFASPRYPCIYLEVICVAATTADDRKAAFSNFQNDGLINLPTLQIAAPGDHLLMLSARGGVFVGSGTSFAAPLVAGTLAMLRAGRPNESPLTVLQRLFNGADRLPSLSGLVGAPPTLAFRIGRRLNTYRALVQSRILLADLDYCATKAANGSPRWQNWPYANFGDPDIDGSSSEKAYTICTKRQLLSIRESERDRHFALMKDIDWHEPTHLVKTMIGQDWSLPFTGTFTGNGLSVFNIRERLAYGWGLFKHLGPGSRLVSLNVRQMDVEAGPGSGALSLRGEGSVNFVQVEGRIHATKDIGGLFGEARGATVFNSFFEGIVSADSGVAGGIAGRLHYSSKVENSGVRAEIRGGTAGGIAGFAGFNTLIQNSYAFVDLAGNNVGAIAAQLQCASIVRATLTSGKVAGGSAAGIASVVGNSYIAFSYSLADVGILPDGGGVIASIADDRPIDIGRGQTVLCKDVIPKAAPSLVDSVYYLERQGAPRGAAGDPKDFDELIDPATFPGWKFGFDWTRPSPKPETPRVLRVPRSVGAYHPDLWTTRPALEP